MAITSIGLFAAVAIFALALSAVGGATAQGRTASAAFDAVARQPEAAGNVQSALILSLAFIESLTLFVFAMIFILAGQVAG